MEEGGEMASVVIEPEDLSGNYDYIPDVKSMSNPEPAIVNALTQLTVFAKDPAAVQARMMDGQRLKLSEVEKDLFELLGLKNAEKYYERSQDVLSQGGAGITAPGQVPPQPNGATGIPGGAQAVAGGA